MFAPLTAATLKLLDEASGQSAEGAPAGNEETETVFPKRSGGDSLSNSRRTPSERRLGSCSFLV
jgi:hypothetical protein